jgi:hypothetical protein
MELAEQLHNLWEHQQAETVSKASLDAVLQLSQSTTGGGGSSSNDGRQYRSASNDGRQYRTGFYADKNRARRSPALALATTADGASRRDASSSSLLNSSQGVTPPRGQQQQQQPFPGAMHPTRGQGKPAGGRGGQPGDNRGPDPGGRGGGRGSFDRLNPP